jgi:hypothetical protein
MGAYDFAAHSWSWRETSSHEFAFCDCVVNFSQSMPLWIEWPAVGLKGIVAPNQPGFENKSYIYSTFDDDKATVSKEKLYFGVSSETAIDTTRHVGSIDISHTTSLHSDSRQLIFADYGGDAPEEYTISSKVYIPNPFMMAAAHYSDSEIRIAVEQNPSILIPAEMTFKYRIEKDGPHRLRVHYECAYNINSGSPFSVIRGKDAISLKIEDHDLHKLMFRTEDPIVLGGWHSPAPVFEADMDLPNAKVSIKDTKLDIFIAEADAPIATMPIQFVSAGGAM